MPARIGDSPLSKEPTSTRLTPDQQVWIESVAQKEGKKQSTVLRECVAIAQKLYATKMPTSFL
jgi:hypothetical protein